METTPVKDDGPAGEQPAGLFASITGVAERPAVGDSILPQWGGLSLLHLRRYPLSLLGRRGL